MDLNADFTRPAVVRPEDYRWVDSPMPGVERMMLDRIGDEVARATSLVRYAPNSVFSPHVHGGGEEFLVLEGVFADEHREYPTGTYVRNPIGTKHSPRVGDEGCVIFVKLHQFDTQDQTPVVIDTNIGEWLPGSQAGVEIQRLHDFGNERVVLVRVAPDTSVPEHTHEGGEESLVIEGCFYDEKGAYPAGTWVRLPDKSSHTPYTKEDGVLIYVKAGHLGPAVCEAAASRHRQGNPLDPSGSH